MYCDHVGSHYIYLAARKSEFVLQYLLVSFEMRGENEWVVVQPWNFGKEGSSIRNKEESQQKDDAGNKKKGEKEKDLSSFLTLFQTSDFCPKIQL